MSEGKANRPEAPEEKKTGFFSRKTTKKEKVKKEKAVKSFATPSQSTMAGGKAVRRIKTVGGGASSVKTVSAPVAAKAVEPVAPSKPLPNPLPTPKKKDHKPIDFDEKVKKKTDDDWDFDYDVGDDDDWDV